MTVDLAVADKIKQLRRVGLRPPERLAQQILHAGDAAVGPLLVLATETGLLHEEEPECFAPIHALRLLGELHPFRMIEPLLEQMPLDQDYPGEELPVLWTGEAPQMIGRLGEPAVTRLWEIADDTTWNMSSRGGALTALVYMTAILPELRESLVAGLRERLALADDKEFAGHLVAALSGLGVSEAYSDIMALYRQGRISHEIIAPRRARQLLLTSSDEHRLECINHSLWERYDLHGPFPDEEEQAV